MDNVVNKAEGEWQLTVHHTVCSVTQSIGPLRHGTGPLGLESGFKGEERQSAELDVSKTTFDKI